MVDIPFMDEENHAERARQDALWALREQPIAPQQPVMDQEITPQQLRDETFAKSPFGAIDRTLKAGTDWIKGRMKKRQAPFEAAKAKDQEAGLSGFPTNSWPDPVELIPTMLLEGGRTANRWLYGTKDPTQLRDEDTLGPLGMSAMGAPFAAMKHGVSLGSAGGKLAGTGNPGSPPFSRQVDDLGYYSKLDEVLGTLKPTDTVTMDTLAKRGVKAAEIEARGLSPFIADGKGAKVGDLQGGAQPVQVRESQYGGPAPANWEYLAKGQYGKSYSELSERARLDIRRQSEVDDYKDPKWRDYATDGDNPSYHEGVLHLPESPFTTSRKDRVKELDRIDAERGLSSEEMSEYMKLREQETKPDQTFRSGHWDEPNAIAHYRASMQPTEGGGKAYLIDELQSDWGQKLRDGGVRDETKIDKLRADLGSSEADLKKQMGDLGVRDRDYDGPIENAWSKFSPESQQELSHLGDLSSRVKLLRAELSTAEAATPGNPFVNTSEQWMTTALRRMMRNAAEQQADGIAITPGAVHNERFNLSKQVRSLAYEPETGTLKFQRADSGQGRPDPNFTIAGRGIKPEELSSHVGKEMADRLLATPPRAQDELYGGNHVLDDLGSVEIGGEGMKYAYDKILPKLLGKELSKLDPSIKYGQQMLRPEDRHNYATERFNDPFHHFPLTPKAREEIMKGLPLFNAPGGPEAIMEALRANQQLQGPFAEE